MPCNTLQETVQIRTVEGWHRVLWVTKRKSSYQVSFMFDPRDVSALVPGLLNYFSNNKSRRIESMQVNLKTTAKYHRWEIHTQVKSINYLLRSSTRKKTKEKLRLFQLEHCTRDAQAALPALCPLRLRLQPKYCKTLPRRNEKQTNKQSPGVAVDDCLPNHGPGQH